MILVKNNLIFGTIKSIIVFIFKIIYKIIAFLNLQFSLLIALVGLVLFLTGVFEGRDELTSVFLVILICSVVFSIIGTLFKWLNISPKRKKRGNVKISNENSADNGANANVNLDMQNLNTQNANLQGDVVNGTLTKYPIYYTVKQNNAYVMAEYEDRYELYLKTPSGLKKVRVDYKNNIINN